MSQLDFLFLLPERSKESVNELLCFFVEKFEVSQLDFLLEDEHNNEVYLTESIEDFFCYADQNKTLHGRIYWHISHLTKHVMPKNIFISYTLDGKIIGGITLFETHRDILIDQIRSKYGNDVVEGVEMVPPIRASDLTF